MSDQVRAKERKKESEMTAEDRLQDFVESLLKRRDKLQAIEKGVTRLLDMCETVMAEEKGVIKVPWRRSG